MANRPEGEERRLINNAAIRALVGTCKQTAKDTTTAVKIVEDLCRLNGVKLDTVNGSVKRHKVHFIDVFKRLRGLEDNDLFEDGVKHGKTGMKTSTRNMLILIIMGLGCLFAGLTVFKTSQSKMESAILAKMNGKMDDRYRGADANRDILKVLEEIKKMKEGTKTKK